MTIDAKKRLYLVTNQRVAEQPWHINRVVIFRSEPLDATGVPRLKPWLRSSYPWGFSYYNHGVCHIAEGPDGLIYVSSGARTAYASMFCGAFILAAGYVASYLVAHVPLACLATLVAIPHDAGGARAVCPIGGWRPSFI